MNMTVNFVIFSFLAFCLVLGFGVYVTKQKVVERYRRENYPPEPSTYEDLLKCEEWKEKRDKILKRDRYRCRWCRSKKSLQVHHKYYSRYPNGQKVEPWNYPDDALITLCDKCHEKAHKKTIKLYWRSYDDNY